MSRFTKINTQRERGEARPLLEELKEKRAKVRRESLILWSSQAIKHCTVERVYVVGFRTGKKGLSRVHRRAWHYHKDLDPSIPLPQSRNFSETIIRLAVDINRVALVVERANVYYPAKWQAIWPPLTKFVELGQIALCVPETQKGRSIYAYGFTGFSEEQIRYLFEDLKIFQLSEGREIVPQFLRIESIEMHDIYAFGKAILG